MANTVRRHIEQLPSGSFRVHVYAGTDPVTGRPRRLQETCPDEAAAAATLGRLLNEADGGRFPNRAATLSQALDKYLEVTDLELSTKEAHQGYIRRTEILPVIKRWMASLALSWKDGLARSGKMSAWLTNGPLSVLAALA